MGGNCIAYKELIKYRFKIMTLLTRKKNSLSVLLEKSIELEKEVHRLSMHNT